MRKHHHEPYSNQNRLIPKDRRVALGKTHPVDYYNVSAQDIAVGQVASGSAFANPNNPPSGAGAGEGGAPGSIENLVKSINSILVSPSSIDVVEDEAKTFLLSTEVNVNRLNVDLLTFQWQKKVSGGSFTDIAGETNPTFTVGSGVTVAADNNDEYRCQVFHVDAVTSPKDSNSATLTVTRKIEVTTQPILGIVIPQGSPKTFEAVATITSGTFDFQWQVKLSGTTLFTDIVGANGTGQSSGSTVSYTTSNQSTDNNGDQYRVIFSNSNAPDTTSSAVTMAVSGADFRIQPALNGVEFWSFEKDGSLVFDPSTATDYSITSLENDRSKISTHLWGQGRCDTKGGYTDADIPISGADVLALKMNAGGGAAGSSDSGRYAEAGGGYAGIFDTSVSHANALAIAGGAGGSSLNTSSTCGGSQQPIQYAYSYQQSYQSTCYQTIDNSVTKSGSWAHSYDNANRRDAYLAWYGNTSVIYTVAPPSRYYIIGFDSPMPSSNYILQISTNGCTAGGGLCPGFSPDYSQITRTSAWMVLAFRRNDAGNYRSFVSTVYWTITHQDTRTISYPCTQYYTVQGSYPHTGTAKVTGGAGGGTTGSDGFSSTSSVISAKGGYGATQSLGGTGGSTSSGGSTNGKNGSTLSGGRGGNNSGSYAAAGGGGGGGGYYGGGGGAGGYDGYNGSSNPGRGPQSGGGGAGGAGFIHSTATGTTGVFGGSSHPNRGSAGNAQQNSRIVIEASFIDITTQPSSVVLQSGTATFNVVATVSGISGQTVSYQWQKRGSGQNAFSDIRGATSASYTTPTLTNSNNNDRYRCKLENNFCASKITEEVVTLFTSSGSQTYTITQTGSTTIPVPDSATEFTYAIWGAGGEGTGECPTGSFSGGTGAHARGTVLLTGSYAPGEYDTNSIRVFVGTSGQGSPNGQAGYGAGRGGQGSDIYYQQDHVIVGGGGGAGQNGQGGYGGVAGSGSGGVGSGPNNGFAGGGNSGGSGGSSNDRDGGGGSNGQSGGGAPGGSGRNQGNRGGGGGGGLYGGGGGGGYDTSNCTGGGGGGGSGSVTLPSSDKQNGNVGSAGGSSPPGTTVAGYVSGRGGSNQDGLVVISMVIPGALSITGVDSATVENISNLSSTKTLTESVFLTPSAIDYNVTVKLRGNTPSGNGGTGGYVEGTFTAEAGQSYLLHYTNRYAAVFYGTSATGNKCIMLAAEGGYESNPGPDRTGNGHPSRPNPAAGGNAGLPSGSVGSNLNNSYGGTGGIVNGYKSGQGGNGGQPGSSDGYSGSKGGDGAFFSSGGGGSGTDGDGGAGGFGYYGGGGGGGGWDLEFNAGGYFGGGGGGGASYIGGLPTPAQNANSPAEVTVSNTSYGNEAGSPQIQIISVAQA